MCQFYCFLALTLILSANAVDFPECKRSTFGFDYRGKLNVTVSGKTCQSWSSQTPHSHTYTSAENFPDPSMAEVSNYCRNPDDESGGPWCYTTDPDARWEFCDVSMCWPYVECKMTSQGTEYRGSLSVTVTGKTCLQWTNGLDYNYCRNPDDKAAPWCYVQGTEWEYCDVKFCKPSATCKISQLGQEYIGTVSDTAESVACQRWQDQAPHQHAFNDPSYFPDTSLEDVQNFCRNPDGKSSGPWCYTQDPDVRYAFCDVPLCQDCKSSETGWEYAGALTTTQNGYTCQAWASQTPHNHDYTDPDRFPDMSVQAASNYCRNPTGSSLNQPWCFTTDTDMEWDYCDIPACTEALQPHVPLTKHVLYIGIDGLKPSCFPEAPGGTPNILQRLGAQGTSTLTQARTVLRTWSAPGWSSGLCGLTEAVSGITGNGWKPTWQGFTESITPVTGANNMVPCVFHQLKSRDANIRTAAFYNWDWFKYMTNRGYPGYVDHEIYYTEGYKESDAIATNDTIAYLRETLVSVEKSFTFTYLGYVDVEGHEHSWCHEKYLEAVAGADSQVGQMLDLLDDMGMADDVLVILAADHGGHLFGHGEMLDADILIPMFLRGPGVRKDAQFTNTVYNQDIVPTAFYALGLRPSPWWTGEVMAEAFQDTN